MQLFALQGEKNPPNDNNGWLEAMGISLVWLSTDGRYGHHCFPLPAV
jgi:hypothetical protein